MAFSSNDGPVLREILAEIKSLNEKVDILIDEKKDKKDKEIKESFSYPRAEQYVRNLKKKGQEEEAKEFISSLDGWSLSEKTMLERILEED
ncbi:hypothetical protein ABES80_10255 [Bacillus gobiensis]|uniref:hypothetical protein n=1 Tax=Bacillus gobiensis TaxID=1441095 RepID=UPI003D2040F1